MLKKKIWVNFEIIIELFTHKIVTKLSKIWIWDPRSGKNLFRIPDTGVKKAPDPGSATLLPFMFYDYPLSEGKHTICALCNAAETMSKVTILS